MERAVERRLDRQQRRFEAISKLTVIPSRPLKSDRVEMTGHGIQHVSRLRSLFTAYEKEVGLPKASLLRVARPPAVSIAKRHAELAHP